MQEEKLSRRPAEQKTYTGSCHCGAVRFAVTVAIDKLGAFELRAGTDAQTDYQLPRRC